MAPASAADIEAFIHRAFPAPGSEPSFAIETAEGDVVRVRFFARSDQLRPGGTVAGPVQMAAADLAAWALLLHKLGLEAAGSVTSSLNMSFLARPAPGDLLAEAELLKLGKRQAVCAVRIRSAGLLVAHATVTYAVALADPLRGAESG